MAVILPTSAELVKKVRESLDSERDSDDLIKVIVVAYEILEHFLGLEFCDRYIAPDNPDPYMQSKLDDTGPMFHYQDRLARLADYLFTLQNEPGFDALLERFTSNRDLKSVYLEASTAAFFKKIDFDVEILQLTGVRGEDFDFIASKNGVTLNVEVTGCANERFSIGNVQNILSSKRTQLPARGPGLLYCIVPQVWEQHYSDLWFGLQYATHDFFGKSKTGRLNAVIFAMTQMRRIGDGAMVLDVFTPVFNPASRNKVDLSFLVGDKSPEIRQLVRAMRKAPDGKRIEPRFDSLSYWPLICSRGNYPSHPSEGA